MESHQYASRRTLQNHKSLSISDCVVDGILQGMFAGIVMLALFIVMARIVGKGLPELLSMLGAPDAASSPLQGALRHIAVSALYGIAWSLAVVLPIRRLRLAAKIHWRMLGIAFGILLWLVALIVIQYWTALSLLPWYALLIAHMAYGGTLGYMQVRRVASR